MDGGLTVTGPDLSRVARLGAVDSRTFLPAGFAGIRLIFHVEDGRTDRLVFEEDGEPTVLQKKDLGKK